MGIPSLKLKLVKLVGQICGTDAVPNSHETVLAAHKTQHPPLWKELLYQHFPSTLLIVSTLFLFEHFGMLNWLDNTMLRMAVSLHDQSTEQPSSSGNAVPVITIGNQVYEDTFRERSPLDSGRIAELITRIADQKPAQIALDIDLSPTIDDAGIDRILDRELVKVAQSAHVLLVLPDTIVGERAWRVKKSWMDNMCRQGIDFALPMILSTQGTFIRYNGEAPTLGILAARWIEAHEGSNHVEQSESICDTLRDIDNPQFYDGAFRRPLGEAKTPLNYNETGSAQVVNASWTDSGVALNRPIRPSSTIFVGGAWGHYDTYTTPVGDRFGVEIHALTYISKLHPVSIKHWEPILLDIVVGVFIGYLLTRGWTLYVYGEQATYSMYVIVPWLIFGGILALMAFMLWGMQYLLSKQLWLNAAPLLVGLLLDSHNTAIESLMEKTELHKLRRKGVDCYICWLKVAIYLVLVCSALYILLQSLLNH